MENLIFSLNATMPVFLLMAAGYLMHLAGLIDTAFAGYMNRFVFRVALPLMLFRQIEQFDFPDTVRDGILFGTGLSDCSHKIDVVFLCKTGGKRCKHFLRTAAGQPGEEKHDVLLEAHCRSGLIRVNHADPGAAGRGIRIHRFQ